MELQVSRPGSSNSGSGSGGWVRMPVPARADMGRYRPGATAGAGRRRAATRRQGHDHPCDHDRGALTHGLALAGADGLGTGRLVHLPLGRPAPVPGQRPQRRPHPPRTSAAGAGRSRPRRPTRGGLLVHRGADRAGPAAGAAVDPAPAAVVAAAGAGDGLDLELAAGRADLWVYAGGAAQPDVPAPLVVRAGVSGRDRPGGLCHGPQPPAGPAATGRSCRGPGDRQRRPG